MANVEEVNRKAIVAEERKKAAAKEEMGVKAAKLVEKALMSWNKIPKRFREIRGIHLFGNRYRVNVYVETDEPEVLPVDRGRIALSYAVEVEGGKIRWCDPKIGRV